eukprot:9054386-Alexandrium_andersonii.AAC.1
MLVSSRVSRCTARCVRLVTGGRELHSTASARYRRSVRAVGAGWIGLTPLQADMGASLPARAGMPRAWPSTRNEGACAPWRTHLSDDARLPH